jgi:hypothetical protein
VPFLPAWAGTDAAAPAGGVNVSGFVRAQGNRNPFIDFPQFADAIFLNATTQSFSKWQLQNFTLAQLQSSITSSSGGDADGDVHAVMGVGCGVCGERKPPSRPRKLCQ